MLLDASDHANIGNVALVVLRLREDIGAPKQNCNLRDCDDPS